VNHGGNRTSFNGGPGGIPARPSHAEAAVAQQHGQRGATLVAQQKATPGGRPGENQARPAEPQNRMATRANPTPAKPTPPKPNEARPANNTRVVPQQNQRAEERKPSPVQAARTATPSRPAPQQRSAAAPEQRSAPRAAAPEQRAAPHAAAPEHAAARPEGKEERK
jgi:hypothetical protein